MKKVPVTILISFIFAILLGACVTNPPVDTNAKRLVMVEATYGEVLTKAIQYRKAGRLESSQQAHLTDLFNEIELGINLARTAHSMSDIKAFEDNASAALTAISTIRQILTEVETYDE